MAAQSYFEHHSLKDLYAEIRDTYLANDLPWVIGYSGGKDSTATLQMIWHALKELEPDQRQKPVFVISSDTLVETPVVVDYINNTLDMIGSAAEEQGMPFTAHKVTPKITESFWVNLIGRGYPAPSQRFRWCTERMKINPANQFIMDSAAEFGEVVVVLGARKAESMSRAQVLNDESRRIPGSRLTRHSKITRAYVYTPIEELTTDDVWTFLLQVPSPWGGQNRDLAAMYRSTGSGECPLVVDDTTPSCGNSRFGCWVCTVVSQDKSMQGLIDNGEDWMIPLLDFRDQLAATQVPENKRLYRDFKRRDGRVILKDGTPIPGPYTIAYRKQLLRELLELQKEVQAEGPDPDLALIQAAELHEIRRLWRTECSDWEDSVPKIYHGVFGDDLNWVADDQGAFSMADQELLGELCQADDVPLALVTRLIDTESRMQGMGRRSGIYNQIGRIFREEWGTEEEVIERHEAAQDRLSDLELE